MSAPSTSLKSRASRYTARYMLAGDIAYVLSAAELNCTPATHARKLLQALIDLFGQLPELDTTKPPADIVSQREAWIQEQVGRRRCRLAAPWAQSR